MSAYEWTYGSRMIGDAETAGKVCEKLESEGRLTPANLVDESRASDAPLHGMFEWDDAVAGEKYREQQAAKIIRSIVKVGTCEKVDIRAFHSTPQSVYMSTEKIMRSDDLRKALLETAKQELRAFERKYKSLEELAGVFTAIRLVID